MPESAKRHFWQVATNQSSVVAVVEMASILLRRRLVHNVGLAQRRLLSSTPSALAQAAPPGPSASTLAGKDALKSRHIAEDLGGVSASEILAESGTRKDAQMRHFTGEDIVFLSCRSGRATETD